MNFFKALWPQNELALCIDSDIARREYMTRVVILVLSVVTVSLFLLSLAGLIMGMIPFDTVIALFIMNSLYILSIVISVRKGLWRFTSWVPVVTIFIGAVYGNYIGGIGSPLILVYVLAVVMASMLLGRKPQWTFVFLSLLSYCVIAVADYYGIITAERSHKIMIINRMVIVTATIVCISALLHFLINRFQASLAEACSRRDETYSLAMQIQQLYDQSLKEVVERQSIEAALRQSQERYRLIMKNSDDIIYTLNEEGVFTYVSPAWNKLLGHDINDVTGHLFQPFVHPDDVHRCIDYLAQVLAGKQSQQGVQYRVRHANGTWRWHMTIASRLIDDAGNVLEYIGIARDITDYKFALESLRNSEARLSSIIEGLPIPIFVLDRDHRVIHWNRAIHQVTGISPGEIIGTQDHWKAFYNNKRPCMADLLVDDRIDRIPELYQGKYAPSSLVKGAYEAVDFFPDIGDEGKWFRFTAAAIKDINESIVGSIETLEDITTVKNAEMHIHEAHRRLNEIIEFLPDPTFVIDTMGRVMAWNRAMEEMTGIAKEDILGKGDHEYSIPFYGDRRRILIDIALQNDDNSFSSYDSYSRQGDKIWGEVFVPEVYCGKGAYLSGTASKLRNSLGEIAGAIESIRDITDSKTAEKALLASLNEKEVLLKEIHHRVKNNLNVIVSLLGLQAENEKNDSARNSLYVTKNRIFAISLIHELLYRMEDLSHIDFKSYIIQMVKQLHSLYVDNEKTITETILVDKVILDVTQAVPCGILINEIVTNAYKHAFTGRQEGNIRIEMNQINNNYVLTIGDDGIGIPDDNPQNEFTLGMELIRILAINQLKGEFKMWSENGLKYRIDFPVTTRDRTKETA